MQPGHKPTVVGEEMYRETGASGEKKKGRRFKNAVQEEISAGYEKIKGD